MMDRYSLPHLVGWHQQAADPALSRRGAHRRVLRHGDRRSTRWRAQLGMRAARGAPRQSRAAARRCPTTTSRSKHFDSGDYPEALRRAVAGDRSRRHRARARSAASATGAASASASRSSASRARTAPRSITAGAFRWCPATSRRVRASRPTACSSCASACTRTARAWRPRWRRSRTRCSASIPSKVRLVHGDTALTPYSTGTWGSRCMVMAGGAVADGLPAARRAHAAHRRDAAAGREPDAGARGRRGAGRRHATGGCRLAEVAHTWYRAPQHLPRRRRSRRARSHRRLQGRARHRHASAMPAMPARCAVDTETGHVEILDYVVVEDGGKLVNPMIVDGQVLGGIAQGIGTALYEEMPFDEQGQPLASTLADYLLPGATEVPDDPDRPHGDAVALYATSARRASARAARSRPPAAIVNAINDALAPLGVEVTGRRRLTPARAIAGGDRSRREPGAMKAAPFDYARPDATSPEAREASGRGDGATAVAGDAVAGPDAQPAPGAADAARRPARICRSLPAISETADDALRIGACVDARARSRMARVPDPTARLHAPTSRATSPIAPVRNRGTIGGSLAHADPAADWVARAAALGATASSRRPGGRARDCRRSSSSPASSRPRWPTTKCSPAFAVPKLLARERAGATGSSAARPASSPQAIGGVLDDARARRAARRARRARRRRRSSSRRRGADRRSAPKRRRIARGVAKPPASAAIAYDRQTARRRAAPRDGERSARMTPIALTVNGEPVQARGRAAHASRRFSARASCC